MTDSDARATLIASHLVRSGREREFERWADRFEDAGRARPGVVQLVRLEQPTGLFHFIQHFDSADDLRRWRESAEFRELAEMADDLSVGQGQTASGGRVAVRLPSEAAVPKWKTGLATWAAVFPLLLALNGLLGLARLGLPAAVELALTSLAMTATLTWWILPQIRKLLRPWLFRTGDGGLRKDPG